MRFSAITILVGLFAAMACAQQKQLRTSPTGYTDTPVLPGQKWKVHDIDRPRPHVVTPGAAPGAPPSDAIVLFDGKDLSKWAAQAKPGWKVQDGYVEVVGGSGDLVSKEKFGNAQIHVE